MRSSEKRSRIWLAGLFGLADGVAFLIGAGLGVALLSQGASEVMEIGALVALGLYLLVVAAGTARVTARWVVWVLPFALIFDNLTYGVAGEQQGAVLGDALAQATSSALLAFAGLLLAGLLPVKAEKTRFAGAALLIGAGALFLVG